MLHYTCSVQLASQCTDLASCLDELHGQVVGNTCYLPPVYVPVCFCPIQVLPHNAPAPEHACMDTIVLASCTPAGTMSVTWTCLNQTCLFSQLLSFIQCFRCRYWWSSGTELWYFNCFKQCGEQAQPDKIKMVNHLVSCLDSLSVLLIGMLIQSLVG